MPSLTSTAAEKEHEEGEPITIPASALHLIEITPFKNISLDPDDCQDLGLSGGRFVQLDRIVKETVAEWQAGEKARMRVIPATEPNQILIHIPAIDAKTAEAKGDELRRQVDEVASPGLQELLRQKLTDGHAYPGNPPEGSNTLRGLTAGFGARDRFIRVVMNPRNPSYYTYDVDHQQLEGVAIDQDLFDRLYSSGFKSQQTQGSFADSVPERLQHLLPIP